MTLMDQFLKAVDAIKATKPKYVKTGDGSNGTCDCVGLIIGALRRIGVGWKDPKGKTAIHGSNYAARNQVSSFKYITDANQLSIGDLVFKAWFPADRKYDLPSRYKVGGAYYNGDMKDYYHIGVVTSTKPLAITHMTTPTVKVDTKLGKWNYAGKHIKLTGEDGTIQQAPVVTPVKQEEEACVATVVSPNGNSVKMRAKPSTLCALWDKIPSGTKLTLLEQGEEWCKVSFRNRKGWYMMTKFLKVGK